MVVRSVGLADSTRNCPLCAVLTVLLLQPVRVAVLRPQAGREGQQAVEGGALLWML